MEIHAGQARGLSTAARARRRPCTTPNKAWPAGVASNARLQRSAQRSDSRMARSTSVGSAATPGIRRAASRCRSEQALDLDAALGRKCDQRAVEMGAEGHAVLVDLAQIRERHDLEAAGIGEDRMRPVDEAVQPAERGDALGAGRSIR